MQKNPVLSVSLPDFSALHSRIASRDFLDCYRVSAQTTPRMAAKTITSFPSWAQMLLKVRRLVTAPFGLDNDGPRSTDKVGIFPIESDGETELIAGFNDKHLNFRVSVLAHEGQVFLATWAHPHNIGGRIYLAIIYPFHVAISRNALRRVARSYPAAVGNDVKGG